MKTIDEVIELWKDFESRATAKRSTQISRIKEDREFLSGKQWDRTMPGGCRRAVPASTSSLIR